MKTLIIIAMTLLFSAIAMFITSLEWIFSLVIVAFQRMDSATAITLFFTVLIIGTLLHKAKQQDVY